MNSEEKKQYEDQKSTLGKLFTIFIVLNCWNQYVSNSLFFDFDNFIQHYIIKKNLNARIQNFNVLWNSN